MKFSKKIIVTVITMNVIFVTAVLFVFFHTASEPSTLIASWFAFMTAELWSLKEIKVNENEDAHQSKRKKTKSTKE